MIISLKNRSILPLDNIYRKIILQSRITVPPPEKESRCYVRKILTEMCLTEIFSLFPIVIHYYREGSLYDLIFENQL